MTTIEDAKMFGSMWVDGAELDSGIPYRDFIQILTEANDPSFPVFNDEALDDAAWGSAWDTYQEQQR